MCSMMLHHHLGVAMKQRVAIFIAQAVPNIPARTTTWAKSRILSFQSVSFYDFLRDRVLPSSYLPWTFTAYLTDSLGGVSGNDILSNTYCVGGNVFPVKVSWVVPRCPIPDLVDVTIFHESYPVKMSYSYISQKSQFLSNNNKFALSTL